MAAIAPMEMVKTEPTTIPLLCSLCPRGPKFSDVSHLLTHISSKTHLSNRFHLELKSKQDARAKHRLDRYEEWYHEYDIEDLLQARMNAKDQKKSAKRPRNAHSTSRNSLASGTSTSGIKVEAGEDDESTQPRLHHWHTVPMQQGFQPHLLRPDHAFEMPAGPSGLSGGLGRRVKRDAPDSDVHGDYDANAAFIYPPPPEYQTPTARRGRARNAVLETPEAHFPPSVSHSRSVTDTTGSAPSSFKKEKKGGNGHNKLKGILWPGMAWFDSAPEEKKRMRNQRKDVSVLIHMEATSASIRPTEQVWDLEGELQRTRDVYATPSVTGSPEPEPIQVKPQKQRKPRKAGATARGRKPPTQSKLTTTRPKRVGPTTNVVTRSTSKKKAKLELDFEDNIVDEDETEDEVLPNSIDFVEKGTYSGLPATNSVPDSPLDKKGLHPRERTALQPLDANQTMPSQVPNDPKARTLPYLNSGLPSFHSPASRFHDYVGAQHGLAPLGPLHPLGLPNTLNPLWTQRGHPSYQYVAPYIGPSFNSEISQMRGSPATTTSGFRTGNVSSGLGFHHYGNLSRGHGYDGGDAAGNNHFCSP